TKYLLRNGAREFVPGEVESVKLGKNSADFSISRFPRGSDPTTGSCRAGGPSGWCSCSAAMESGPLACYPTNEAAPERAASPNPQECHRIVGWPTNQGPRERSSLRCVAGLGRRGSSPRAVAEIGRNWAGELVHVQVQIGELRAGAELGRYRPGKMGVVKGQRLETEQIPKVAELVGKGAVEKIVLKAEDLKRSEVGNLGRDGAGEGVGVEEKEVKGGGEVSNVGRNFAGEMVEGEVKEMEMGEGREEEGGDGAGEVGGGEVEKL
ncbi:smr (Small MutS Related) domain-containing protein, partial [Striga asiatica]